MEAASVAIRIQLGKDGIRQALPLADVLEEARTHPAAQQRIQHVTDKAVFVRYRIRRHAEADVYLLERFLVTERDARMRHRRPFSRQRIARLNAGEVFASQIGERLMR